jgi:prepilin-type N-terminal cleavage/methylation domain-containing protein
VTGRGFSLVEIVVTLAIAGLVLALVIGGMSMTTNRRLAGSARKLLSDLRMAEQRARTERNCYRFVFDPAGETYSIYRYEGAVTPAPAGGGDQCRSLAWSSAPVVREDSADAVSRRMPRGVNLVSTTFSSETLTISPLGNGNAGSVCLRSYAGQSQRIVVEVMGRAEMQDTCP